MLKSTKANLLAALRAKELRKERLTRVKKDYATEIERCGQLIKETIDLGRMECYVVNLTPSYNVVCDVEWYMEQFGYTAYREKAVEGNYYNLKISWYN